MTIVICTLTHNGPLHSQILTVVQHWKQCSRDNVAVTSQNSPPPLPKWPQDKMTPSLFSLIIPPLVIARIM